MPKRKHQRSKRKQDWRAMVFKFLKGLLPALATFPKDPNLPLYLFFLLVLIRFIWPGK